MEHDDIRYDIPAWAAGRLDPAKKRRLEAHFEQCTACRAVASTALTLAQAIDRDGAELFEAHPDVADLQRHAEGIPSPRDPELARHLASCASCSMEHRAWQARSAGLNPGQHLRPWWRDVRTAAAGLAAGLLLGLLVAPEMREPRGPATAEASPVPRLLLHSIVRGAEASPELTWSTSSTQALVDVAFELPPGIDPTGSIRFEILDGAGRPVWTASQPVSGVAALLAHDELVGFLVPTAVLAEGPHRLEVTLEHAASPPLLVARFGVHRKPQR